jgi:hypothetical protein
MEYECAIISLIYITRLVTLSNGSFVLNEDTWRGAVLSCMLVSSKVWDDFAMFNADYCCIFNGLSLSRINELELQLLRLLMADLHVTASQFAITHFKVQELVTKEEIRRVCERATVNKMGAGGNGKMQRKVALSRASSETKTPTSRGKDAVEREERIGFLHKESEDELTRSVSLADEVFIKVSDSTVASYSSDESKRSQNDSYSTVDRLSTSASVLAAFDASDHDLDELPSDSNLPLPLSFAKKQSATASSYTHPAILNDPTTPVLQPRGTHGTAPGEEVISPITPRFNSIGEHSKQSYEAGSKSGSKVSRGDSYSPARSDRSSLGSQVDHHALDEAAAELERLCFEESEKSRSSVDTGAHSAQSVSVAGCGSEKEGDKMGAVVQESSGKTGSSCWLCCGGDDVVTTCSEDAGNTGRVPAKKRNSGSKQKVIPMNTSLFSPSAMLRRNWEERQKAKLEMAERNAELVGGDI